MGRVIAQQWISVDGLVAGPHGEDDVFNAVEAFAPSEAHNLELLESIDEILLGRQTYQEWVGFWPTTDDEPIATRINDLSKVVCSTSLREAPWGDHALQPWCRTAPPTRRNVVARAATPSSGAASA
jgi:dihydrofolate reductase